LLAVMLPATPHLPPLSPSLSRLFPLGSMVRQTASAHAVTRIAILTLYCLAVLDTGADAISVGERLPDVAETEACGGIKDYVAKGSARYTEMIKMSVSDSHMEKNEERGERRESEENVGMGLRHFFPSSFFDFVFVRFGYEHNRKLWERKREY